MQRRRLKNGALLLLFVLCRQMSGRKALLRHSETKEEMSLCPKRTVSNCPILLLSKSVPRRMLKK